MSESAEYKVEKQDYSRGAWRVLDAVSGEQVWRRELFNHPVMGEISLDGPVCFDRKRDAVAWIAAERTRPTNSRNERRDGVRPSRDSQPGPRPSTGSGLATNNKES
jgi:hypothetical protein